MGIASDHLHLAFALNGHSIQLRKLNTQTKSIDALQELGKHSGLVHRIVGIDSGGNSRRFVSAGADGTVVEWDADRAEPRRVLVTKDVEIRDIACDRDGSAAGITNFSSATRRAA